MKKIARVFPQRTNATPDDELAFTSGPPSTPIDVDEVHVSCTFTYDIDLAETLAEEWSAAGYAVSIGGPAYDDRGAEFTPGRYLKPGYTITSRGCDNKCWFCSVPKREGTIRELDIKEGHVLQDSNLLACSEDHISAVFDMLDRQNSRTIFSGGLEAKRLDNWHVSRLWNLRPSRMFFAYDTPDDLEPLIEAGKKLRYADFTRSHLSCYVLMGYPRDTIDNAVKRMEQTWNAGFLPTAMLLKNTQGSDMSDDKEWRSLQRTYMRPAATKAQFRAEYLAKYNRLLR